MRHARPVDFGVDVADQIGFEVEVLDEREGIVGARARGVAAEHLDGVVAAELGLERVAVKLAAHIVAQDTHAVEISVHRASRQRLESGLRAKELWRPVGLGIDAPEEPECRAPHGERQQRA
jgi:hypothetical protein